MGLFQNAEDWIASARMGKALEAVCPRQVQVWARDAPSMVSIWAKKREKILKCPLKKGSHVDISGKLACTCGYHQQAVSVVT